MAWVRGRGRCAPLLATVDVDGRSRPVCLAHRRGAYRVAPTLRIAVTTASAPLRIDGAARNRALAAAPPGRPRGGRLRSPGSTGKQRGRRGPTAYPGRPRNGCGSPRPPPSGDTVSRPRPPSLHLTRAPRKE